MTDRLPVPGDDFDAWGGILNGFLRVSHNDDGTLKGALRLLGPYSIAWNTPGLTTGVNFYTPTAGDLLLEFILSLTTLWNGTTPKLDIGSFQSGDTAGFLAPFTSLPDLSGSGNLVSPTHEELNDIFQFALPIGVFTGSQPLKVVVSQDGTKGGADPGATQGAADIYLVVATPTIA